jgi:hypothetical protein
VTDFLCQSFVMILWTLYQLVVVALAESIWAVVLAESIWAVSAVQLVLI